MINYLAYINDKYLISIFKGIKKKTMPHHKVVTLEWKTKDYPVNKEHRYKYMVPIHVEQLDGVWYHTFRVTPYDNDEIAEHYMYGDPSNDFD
tara:strand:- start:184 stop:459 length:276 start_codon:yes stop_codon:yes gene_type:complete